MKKFEIKDGIPQFPSFLQGFNRRWYANSCEVVYLCNTNEEVQKALDEAIGLYGRDVKIKCGGHCYENFVFNDSTKAIIDVTNLNEVGYDINKGYYLDAGGTNWASFKKLFRNYGKVLPSGSCYSVGLGGHISGGGYGLLSRLNGLTVDWLTGVDIVIKDDKDKPSRHVYVSKDSTGIEKDLFWAQCGGGGGNFGVITRYYFKKLPDSPNSAFISTYAFDWDEIDVPTLYNLLDWFKTFSEDNTNWNQFGLFKLNHQANGEIHLVIQTAIHDDIKSLQENEYRIKEQSEQLSRICNHRIARSPIVGHSSNSIPTSIDNTLYTYYEATQSFNGSGGPNQRGKYKSAYMRKGFSREDVEVIYRALTTYPKDLKASLMAQSLLQVDSYGGQINTIPTDGTAVPQRDSIFKLQYQTYWTDKRDDEFFLKWIRDFYSELYKNTNGTPNPYLDKTNNVDGCYYNYPDADLNMGAEGKMGAMKLYLLENLDRLMSVKRKWDPNDFFNSEQSIPLK